MTKNSPVSLAISALLSANLVSMSAAEGLQQNLASTSSAQLKTALAPSHIPIDPEDESLSEANRRKGESAQGENATDSTPTNAIVTNTATVVQAHSAVQAALAGRTSSHSQARTNEVKSQSGSSAQQPTVVLTNQPSQRRQDGQQPSQPKRDRAEEAREPQPTERLDFTNQVSEGKAAMSRRSRSEVRAEEAREPQPTERIQINHQQISQLQINSLAQAAISLDTAITNGIVSPVSAVTRAKQSNAKGAVGSAGVASNSSLALANNSSSDLPSAQELAALAHERDAQSQTQASSNSNEHSAHKIDIPHASSLRSPVWRGTSASQEALPESESSDDASAVAPAPHHAMAGADEESESGNNPSAAGSATEPGTSSGANTAHGANQQDQRKTELIAMAGSNQVSDASSAQAPIKERLDKSSPLEAIAKLFKRDALLLDAQTESGNVPRERAAKIIAATPIPLYRSAADQQKEAAARQALLQKRNLPAPRAKADARQSRKAGSPLAVDVTFNLDEVLRALKRENSLIDLRSLGDIITTLRRAVTDHPSDPRLRLKLGSILLLAGDYDGAASEMKRVVALTPKDYRGHLLLAQILDDVGDRENVGNEFRRAIELAPNAPETHCLYADSLVYQGDISAAINEYRRAIGAKPNADALAGLANALILIQDKVGSLKAARQAVSLDPSSARAHVALTKALLLAGDQLASMRTARQAVLLSPALAESHIALGRALHAKGDLDGAVDEFKQAVTLDPLDAQARNDLGYALYSKGDMLGAVTEFRLALRLNPRLGEARNNLEIAIHRLSGRKAP